MQIRAFKEMYAAIFPHSWERDLQIADLLGKDWEVAEIVNAFHCTTEEIYESVYRVKMFFFPGLTDVEIMEIYPPER